MFLEVLDSHLVKVQGGGIIFSVTAQLTERPTDPSLSRHQAGSLSSHLALTECAKWLAERPVTPHGGSLKAHSEGSPPFPPLLHPLTRLPIHSFSLP